MTTKSVTLKTTEWTLISSSPVGMMENTDPDPFVYRSELSQPSPTITGGHILNKGEDKTWQFSLGESVYGRALIDAINITVTEG
jgi:hypothetical protein